MKPVSESAAVAVVAAAAAAIVEEEETQEAMERRKQHVKCVVACRGARAGGLPPRRTALTERRTEGQQDKFTCVPSAPPPHAPQWAGSFFMSGLRGRQRARVARLRGLPIVASCIFMPYYSFKRTELFPKGFHS